jgi:AcrR family transcriptional regulator
MTRSDRAAAPAGLRERKKARTRAAIQNEALRLFRSQGFDATTVEQLAAAADISPSTFFRYFPTKEAVVLYDAIDPRVADVFRAQPPDLSVIEAIRRAIRTTFADMPADERERQAEREALIRTVPELRLRMLEEFARSMDLIVELAAQRSGRSTDDPVVRDLAGAIIGISMAAWLELGEVSHAHDFLTALDEGLARLEGGFKI